MTAILFDGFDHDDTEHRWVDDEPSVIIKLVTLS